MYVCMYVRNRFTIEIYGLRIVYIPLQACDTHGAIVMEIEVEGLRG